MYNNVCKKYSWINLFTFAAERLQPEGRLASLKPVPSGTRKAIQAELILAQSYETINNYAGFNECSPISHQKP
jgi:hypothetical protein